MSTSVLPTPNLSPTIVGLLAGLRRRIRAYVWLQGLAASLVVLELGFWTSLALDWLFEPPAALRVGYLALLAAALGYVLYRMIFRRAFVPLADRNMAMLLERRYPKFADGLLTSVSLSESPEYAADFNTHMLSHTYSEAVQHADGVRLAEIFNLRPLLKFLALGLLLGLGTVAFAASQPDALGIWVRRDLLLSDEPWPRKTHLQIEGFDDNGQIKLARGADLDLLVKAELGEDRLVPDLVEIRYLAPTHERENMTRQGQAVAGKDKFQEYTHKFQGVLSSIDFQVRGGDDRRGPFHIEVVDSPTIRMALDCEYPAYMQRPSRQLPVAGTVQLPRGAKVTILAKANKPLRSVEIEDQRADGPSETSVVTIPPGAGAQEFKWPLTQLDGDRTLLFTLLDDDGIRSREPIRLALGALPDEPPRVDVTLRGISTAITPGARLPATGQMTDDYGVAKAWFLYHVDEQQPAERGFATQPKGQNKVNVEETFEAGELSLQPGQKFHLAVAASDTYNLTGEANLGYSQRYTMDVVTPEKLRAMLEARELMLRRRFETMIEEFIDTRNLLSGVSFSAAKKDTATAPEAGSSEKTETPAADKPVDRAAEPGDTPAKGQAKTELSPERAAEMRRVQLQRVLQNSQRGGHENLELATAFDDIRLELINNRVDTEELKLRLGVGIADPLRRIGGEMFAQLEAELRKLDAAQTDPAAARSLQAAAVEKADIILVQMNQVLKEMLKLEDFNEVLDLLRGIITAQEKVTQETKVQAQDARRRVLEDATDDDE